MRRFDDQKRAATYKERCSPGKMAKSGKQYSSKELKMIACDEEFRACIYAIGFEWLLKHIQTKVPVDLAREFFSTFRLKNTSDLDADSITFRLFNEEHEMSIREWSLRMGLLPRLRMMKAYGMRGWLAYRRTRQDSSASSMGTSHPLQRRGV